jgi:hypothetical protein
MTNFKPEPNRATPPPKEPALSSEVKDKRILCPYCQRTASNGIKCKGICVAESDY